MSPKPVNRTRYRNLVKQQYEYCAGAGQPLELNPAWSGFPRSVFAERMDDGLRPKSKGNLLKVVKRTPVTSSHTKTNGTFAIYTDQVYNHLDFSATYSYIEPYLSRFRWKELPTSNQADLLTAFAELDDTIALLSKRALTPSYASYGTVKWGWMPLISDIMAANDAAEKVKNSLLFGDRRQFPYAKSDRFTIVTPPILTASGSTVSHEWDVKVKHKGYIEYQNDVLAFYDYMGFHPSPKLVWDLIPLSFAIDYILPIGDMLSQLTPKKGWVKSANFTGWRTVRAMCTERVVTPPPGFLTEFRGSPCLFVDRTFHHGTEVSQKKINKEIEVIKTPTMFELFDLTYLSEAFYQRGRKIIAPHVYRKRRRK